MTKVDMQSALEIVTPNSTRGPRCDSARQRRRFGVQLLNLRFRSTCPKTGDHFSQVIPRRRVEERTFAWLSRSRRLARDYERPPETGEAMTHAAMSRIMLRRVAA